MFSTANVSRYMVTSYIAQALLNTPACIITTVIILSCNKLNDFAPINNTITLPATATFGVVLMPGIFKSIKCNYSLDWTTVLEY